MDKVRKLSKLMGLPTVMAMVLASGTSVVAQESPSVVLEEVIVTGHKIARSLQDTPSSVAVINSNQIEERDISEFSEFVLTTANAHSATADGGFSIRGIDAFSVTGGGDSFLASVYVDGAPLPRRLIRSGFSTWDTSQVEILRGPQSTLQGRNALAGAVVLSTTTPTQEWEGRFRAQLGEDGEQEVAFAGGGGLVEDQLAFRFSAETKDFDGFNKNTTRNKPSGFTDNELYRLKLLLTPSNVPDFSALLSLTHATEKYGSITTNVPASGSPYNRRVVTNNDPQTTYSDTDLASLKLDYQLNDYWSLTSVSTYTDVDASYVDYDNDDGPQTLAARSFSENNKTLSQEIRLTIEHEKLTGLIGAYYFDQKIDTAGSGERRFTLASVGVTAPFFQSQFGLDPATASFVVSQYAPLDPALIGSIESTTREISSAALFVDATYEISEKWEVYAGLRWDREKQKNASNARRVLLNAEAIPDATIYPFPLNQLVAAINAQLLANVDNANQEIPLVDANFNEVLPKIGFSYHWTEDLTTSITLQRGYRSGGVGVNPAKSSAFQFAPEFTTNYEFSLRSAWLDGALIANANIFYIDWEDQQVDVQLSSNSFDYETQNAGSSSIKGFELELNYVVSSALSLYGSVGQAKTRFEQFDVVIPTQGGEPVVFDLAGRSFQDAPEWTASIGMTYKPFVAVFANLNANYAGSSSAELNPSIGGLLESDSNFDLQNESRLLVNAQIGYEWDSLGVYLIASNLFDEEYISRIRAFDPLSTNRQTLGNPRQLSLSLRGSF
jgi:iron complex outermembrane receptor protein